MHFQEKSLLTVVKLSFIYSYPTQLYFQGVHLEDPLAPEYSTSWGIKGGSRHGHFANFVIPACLSIPSSDSMSQSGRRDIGHLATELQSQCKTSAPSKKQQHSHKPSSETSASSPSPAASMVVQTKESLLVSRCTSEKQKPQFSSSSSPNPKISVSSSTSQPIIHQHRKEHIPEQTIHPKSSGKEYESTSKSVVSKLKKLPVPHRKMHKGSKGRGRVGMGLSPPITPESKSDSTAYATFSFGSDSETEDSSSGGYLSYSSCAANVASQPSQPHSSTTATTTSSIPTESTSTSSSNRERKRDRNKSRFKKILRPIRRSHSAGCAKDVPAHALFLSQQASEEVSFKMLQLLFVWHVVTQLHRFYWLK